MKLDASVMRTMSRQHFRVLEAVEKGMQNHALVPSNLISSISNLRHGGCHKILSSLLRDNLLSHDQSCGYDGYRLTNSGYDILALWNLKCRGYISALGDKIGTGKESDVYIAATPQGKQIVLKFHRLGRTSFRDVKKKRDYFMINSMKKNKHGGVSISSQDQPNSWLFLSKISALKEFTFMKALYDVGYPTPKPITHNRHIVSMGLIRGRPLYQIHSNSISPDQAQSIFEQSMDMCKQLVRNGLVHCDLNEFNLLVDLSGGVQSYTTTDDSATTARDDLDDLKSVGFHSTAPTNDDVGEHYVRHSGSSASVTGRGMLSVPTGVLAAAQKTNAISSTTIDGAIDSNTNSNRIMDGTGEYITEETPTPLEYVGDGDNKDPKPIVTLIDFPQMISIKHPNAQELWERDIECLRRFFVMKLKFDVSDEEWERIVPRWEDLITVTENDLNEDNDDDDDSQTSETNNDDDEEKSVLTITSKSILASKKQLRLDQELLVSGHSKEDAQRDSQLYYFEDTKQSSNHVDSIPPVLEEEEDEDNDDKSTENIIEEHEEKEHDDVAGLDSADYKNIVLDLNGINDLNNSGGGGLNHTNRENDELSLSSRVRSYAHSQAEEKARERVRKHLEEQKRSKLRKGAFRKGNKNKTFVKGRRVFKDDYEL